MPRADSNETIERHGLLRPSRTRGRQRLYNDADLERLREIRALMERRVNVAGIRVILRLRALAPGPSR